MKWCCYYIWLVLCLGFMTFYNYWFRKTFEEYRCRIRRKRLLGDNISGWTPMPHNTSIFRVQEEKMGFDEELFGKLIDHGLSIRFLGDGSTKKEEKPKKEKSPSKTDKTPPPASSSSTTLTPSTPPLPPGSSSSSSSALNIDDLHKGEWIITDNPLTSIPLWMGRNYGFITLLTIVYSFCFFYFKRLEETNIYQLSKINLFRKVLGFILRLFPLVMKFFHYLVLSQILGQAYKIWSNPHCKTVTHTNKLGLEVFSHLHQYSLWSLIIYSFFWVIIHIFFPIWKRTHYALFFHHEPEDVDKYKIWTFLFIRWGPN